MSDTLTVGLDPKNVVDGMKAMAASMMALADTAEKALGEGVTKPLKEVEEAAEKGSNRISKYFSNMAKRVKDDLKTAFDVGAVLGGVKFAKDLAEGTREVFEMERAFDRLNTRLGLTGKGMSDLKKNLGSAVASTGSRLQDILPGVESAAARANIRDPAQLTQIGKALGQVKQTTGEDVGSLSDTITEIMKNQRMPLNAKSYQSTLDAVQGTRAAGSFKTAGEAASAIDSLSPFGRKLGLDNRQLGGLAAQASQGGQGSLDILRQILDKGTTIEGRATLNKTLGQNIFGKDGKLDTSALGKIDSNRFGNEQILGEASGLNGANGQDLNRFIGAFKSSGSMDRVVKGTDETKKQFEIATDNLAGAIDRFKEASKNAGRGVVGGLSTIARGVMSGNGSKIGQGLSDTGSALWENKGTIAADLGITAGVSVLAGGGAKGLMKLLGGKGLGGAVGGLVGGEAAKAAGVTPVFVINMPAGGLGGSVGDAASGGLGALAGKYGGKIAGLGASALGAVGGLAGIGIGAAGLATAGVAGYAGYKIGEVGTDYAYDKLYGAQDRESLNPNAKATREYNTTHGTTLSPSEYARMIHAAFVSAQREVNGTRPTSVTTPSTLLNRAVGGN